MSVFKNLKSLFVIEEEAEAPKRAAAPTPKAAASSTAPQAKAVSTPPQRAHSPKGSATPDPKFLNVLLEAMEAHNLEGFDYLEFKLSVQSLADLPMDDATRFQSAYAMAKTLGATPEIIQETAKHYMKVLAKEEQKFEGALDLQVQDKVRAGHQEIGAMEATVQDKVQQIAALQAQIQKLEADIATKKEEVATAQAKIEDTKAAFMAAYAHINDQIKDDLAKVEQYLLGKGSSSNTPPPTTQA